MQKKPSPNSISPRATFSLKLAGGLALAIALQTALFSSVLDRTVGSMSSIGAGGLLKAVAGRAHAGLRVAILESKATASLSGPSPAGYSTVIRQWKQTLEEAGIQPRLIGDGELTAELAESTDVLVLPSAICLDDAQRLALQQIIASQRGVVASGATGVRGGKCEWKGWEYLASTFRLDSPAALRTGTGGDPLDDSEAPGEAGREAYVAMTGNRPYSGTVGAGYRLRLPLQEVVIAGLTSADAYLSDAQGRALPLEEPAQEATGNAAPERRVGLARHGTQGGSRYVWFGFQETLPESSPAADRAVLNRFLLDAVLWAGRQPLVHAGAFPHGATAAAIVTEELADGAEAPAAAGRLAQLFESLKIPVTWVVKPGMADPGREPAWVRDLARSGEVAWSGGSRATTAVRRPRLSYLDTIAPAPAHPLRIATASRDDLDILAGYEGTRPLGVDFARRFLPDLDLAQKLNGVYHLSLHSELLDEQEQRSVASHIAESIRSRPVWLAPASQVAAWLEARGKLRVETRMVTAKRIQVAITNTGDTALRGAEALLYLPKRPKTIRVIPELLGRPMPETALVVGKEDVLRVSFTELAPQSSNLYLIVTEED